MVGLAWLSPAPLTVLFEVKIPLLSGFPGFRTVTVQLAFFPLPSAAVAVMVAVPVAFAVIFPADTVAILELLVVQFMVLLLALLGPTVTVKVSVAFIFKAVLVLFKATEVTNCLTVTVQVAFFPLPSAAVAVMVAVPGAFAVMVPADTVAMVAFDVLQLMFLLLALLGPTVTVSFSVAPVFKVVLVLFNPTEVTNCFMVIAPLLLSLAFPALSTVRTCR